jgi:2',3'-cyclic-nucleotide 2'-phosphodiesterase (5'-nucleotidase family)
MSLRHITRRVPFIIMLLLLLNLTGCAGSLADRKAPEPVFLTILFFNDLHGHLKPFEVKEEQGEVGGMARMAALIREIRKENNRRHVRTVVLMAGDMLQGTPMSSVFQGEPDVRCLNAVGLNAAAVGNHEFDFGLDNFLKLKQQAGFPFLSANIVKKADGELLCKPFQTIALEKGLSVTVIGVTTCDLLTTTRADIADSLDVRDEVASVRDAYHRVKSKGPVVLLSHSRHRTDREIAVALPGLAAIIGGHDQILLSPYRRVVGVPIFQAFEKGRYLGRIDLEIDRTTGKARLTGSSYIPIVAGMPEDRQVAAIIADYDKRLGETFREVIGQADTFLDGERGHIRFEETGLGNFVTDIMREHAGAQIAFINAGALRASIKNGPVTVGDVYTAMPYPNDLMVTKLTGKDLEEVLKRAVRSTREEEDGGFLQVSGISFAVVGRQPADIRIGDRRVPLGKDTFYAVAVPDFLSAGGDGYAVLKGRVYEHTGLSLRDLVIKTIRQRGVISAKKEGRIRRIEEESSRRTMGKGKAAPLFSLLPAEYLIRTEDSLHVPELSDEGGTHGKDHYHDRRYPASCRAV